MSDIRELLVAATDQDQDIATQSLNELKRLAKEPTLYEELSTIILSDDAGDENALHIRKLAAIAYLRFVSRIDRIKNSEVFSQIQETSYEIWRAAKDEIINGHVVSIYKVFIDSEVTDVEPFHVLLNQLIESILRNEESEYILFVASFIKETASSTFITRLEEQIQQFLSQTVEKFESFKIELLNILSPLVRNKNFSVTFIDFCIQKYFELRSRESVNIKVYWEQASLMQADNLECLYPLALEDFFDVEKDVESRVAAFGFIKENIRIVNDENIEAIVQTTLELLIYLIENEERDDHLFNRFFYKLIRKNGIDVFENLLYPAFASVVENNGSCIIAFFILQNLAIERFPRFMEQHIEECLDLILGNFAELFSDFQIAWQIKNYLENLTQQADNYYLDRNKMEQLGNNLLEFIEASDMSEEMVERLMFDLLDVVAHINDNFAKEALNLFVRNLEKFSESTKSTNLAYSLINNALFIPISASVELGPWLIAQVTSEEIGEESEIDAMERRVEAFNGLTILKSKYDGIENEGYEEFFNTFISFVFEKSFEGEYQEEEEEIEHEEDFEFVESINGRHQKMKQKIIKTLTKSFNEGRYKDQLIANSAELFEHLREITPKSNADLIQDIDMLLLAIADTQETFDGIFERAFSPIEDTLESYPVISIEIILNFIHRIDNETYKSIIINIGFIIETYPAELVSALTTALRKASPNEETRMKKFAIQIFPFVYKNNNENGLQLIASIASVGDTFASKFFESKNEEIAQIFDINNPIHLNLARGYISEPSTIDFFIQLIESKIDEINDSLLVIRKGLWKFITRLLEVSNENAEKFLDYAKESYAERQDESLETLFLALEAMKPGSIEPEAITEIMGRFPPIDRSECSDQMKFFLMIIKANPTQEYLELGAKTIVLFYATGPLVLKIPPHERRNILEFINIIPIESIEETIKSTELTSAAASEELYQRICTKKCQNIEL